MIDLSYTNKDGVSDNSFNYSKPRTGGYPYITKDGSTPLDGLKNLDYTQRGGATFDGPFKYDKPRDGGYPYIGGGSKPSGLKD